ncbi:ribonuclease H-like domain-containing protein, partial [Tanacetum coccineum]
MADDEVPTNMALMAFSDSKFNKSEFNLANYKRGLASVEEQLVFYKKNEVIFYEQLVVLKRDISYKDLEISVLKDKLIKSQIPDKSRKGLGFVSYNVVPPPPTWLFSPPNIEFSNSGLKEFQQPEFKGYGPKTSKNVCEDTFNKVRESADAPMVKKLVLDDKLEKKTVFPIVTKIEFVRAKQHEKPVRKPVKYAEMYRPKAVNTARPNSAVVNVIRTNQVNDVKASTCWVWRPTILNGALITLKRHNYVDERGISNHPQKEYQGYVDSGCSRHMTENMSYLLDFKEFDGGYMCDKKNSVLFTNTGCFVLSPDFKFVDESQVLRKVPRKNNMHIVDMKNIIPKESLICLVAKATLDESMLWHRRLGKATKSLLYVQDTELYYSAFIHVAYGQDETSDILKSFITEIENLVDKKVKIIRCDNGIEFKNKVMSELYEKKGDRTKWLFDIDVLTKSMNYVPVVTGTNSNDFVVDSSLKNASNDELQPSSDAGKQDDGVRKESVIDNQERPVNSSQDINTDGPSINTGSLNITTGSLNINTDSLTVTTARSNGSQTEPDMFSLGDNATLEATHADFVGDETEVDMSNITTTYPVPSIPNTRIHKDHSLDNVIGDVQSGVQTRRITKTSNEQGFISVVYEGKTHEDLHTFARIEAIRLFLAYASFKDFVVYQMDVKSTFLYGKIKEEVYVYQPPRFKDPEFPDRVYKVEKALYGLHQAPRT